MSFDEARSLNLYERLLLMGYKTPLVEHDLSNFSMPANQEKRPMKAMLTPKKK